ncbi:peptidoglycan DD-metalloendopeptidase family protein [Thioclava sp. GXIMD4215]|uniref:peptidoglycan DD-metalloendopeptidase family protein n=1 Tax=Thioclava sp. GXIMD4215 TaxID=3131928 RepID=UPI003872E5E6
MTSYRRPRLATFLMLGGSAVALAACMPSGNFDPDLRKYSQIGFDTSDAAQRATAPRPQSDTRGIISYPNYQVAVASRGDTVASVAARVGVNANDLARYNAIGTDTVLNQGAVLVLPSRVQEPAGSGSYTGAGATASGGADTIDITSLASNAIDRSQSGQTASAPPKASAPVAGKPAGPEPVRHRVARGETAYSIARYYNVSVRSLADWNGLPSDMSVHEGQYLLIPTALPSQSGQATTSKPGQGSATPTPPSAAEPLPQQKTTPGSAPVDTSAVPNLSKQVTASSSSRLLMPVNGSIIRPYVKKKNDGVDISAAPGTPVKAAADGTVAAITKDTEQVPILVLRHADGLLTVYANIDNIAVSKDATVKRGQTIAKVRQNDPGFVHFEVRQGYESVDPMPYLQ